MERYVFLTVINTNIKLFFSIFSIYMPNFVALALLGETGHKIYKIDTK